MQRVKKTLLAKVLLLKCKLKFNDCQKMNKVELRIL